MRERLWWAVGSGNVPWVNILIGLVHKKSWKAMDVCLGEHRARSVLVHAGLCLL